MNIVERFSDYFKQSNDSKTIIDNISMILNKIDKGYNYSFCSKSVYCFSNDTKSILIFEQDAHTNIQKIFKKTQLIKNIGGFNFYKVDKKLENPFFNDTNCLESHFYFFDKKEEANKKIKYFIQKIFNISDELEHYPSINYNGDNKVEIKILTRDANNITDKDFILAERITEIWNNIK